MIKAPDKEGSLARPGVGRKNHRTRVYSATVIVAIEAGCGSWVVQRPRVPGPGPPPRAAEASVLPGLSTGHTLTGRFFLHTRMMWAPHMQQHPVWQNFHPYHRQENWGVDWIWTTLRSTLSRDPPTKSVHPETDPSDPNCDLAQDSPFRAKHEVL